MKAEEGRLTQGASLIAILIAVVGIPWWASAMDTRMKVVETAQSDSNKSDEDFKKEVRDSVITIKESLVEIKTELKLRNKKKDDFVE